MKNVNITDKSCTFQRGFRPRRKDLFDTPSSPQQAVGYSGKVQDKGNIYIPVLVVVTLFISLGIIATVYVTNQSKLTHQKKYKEMSFQIAEAGVEYYRWHLAHAMEDYQDGTGAPGPYIHDYKDTSGNVIGQFVLNIIAPQLGSTIVTIKSSGHTNNRPNLTQTIRVKMGIPSLTNYAVAANEVMRFGEGTEIFGPIHSNGGIRFDGIAHNLITSSVAQYDDPDHGGGEEFGVHTHVAPTDPLPPSAVPLRADVFMAGRSFPVNTIDFAGITADLQDMKDEAAASGIHLLASGAQGYHITFRNDDKIDMRIVNTQLRCQYRSGGSWYDFGYCSNGFNRYCTQVSQCGYCSGNNSIACTSNPTCQAQGAGTCITTGVTCIQSSHSVGSRASDQSTFTYNGNPSLGVSLPANGIIFIEDDVWVDGTIDSARVTLVAAEEPLVSGRANIFINRDLTYTNYDGSDVIGLIAQENVLVGYFSEDDIRIDAALIAQKGRTGRPYYGTGTSTWRLYPTDSSDPFGEASCANYRKRSQLTTYGAIGTYQRYGFAWVGSMFNCGDHTNQSGYCDRNLIYDQNLYFAPPPFFPTTGQYRIISWEEE